VVKLAGSGRFENTANKTVIETLALEGNLSTSELRVHTSTVETPLRDVSLRYVLREGDLELSDLRAVLLGGRMNASFKMHEVTGAQVSELQATLNDFALARIREMVKSSPGSSGQALPAGEGKATARVKATWRKTFDTLIATVDATAAGQVVNGQSASQPLQADIHASYSAPAQTVSFANSYVLPEPQRSLAR
jgi:uncharacterized protein involved in outer membrane biogenesis